MSLLERLGLKKKDYSTSLTADEMKPIFEFFGIDIETAGFPNMGDRNSEYLLSKYSIWFQDVVIRTIKKNEEVSTVIKGEYKAWAVCSGSKDRFGHYIPTQPTFYKFEIKDGKLEIKYLENK